MGALDYNIKASSGGIVYKGYLLDVASADADDAITVAQLTSVTRSYCVNTSDHAAVTVTFATNVVTVDPAGSLSGAPIQVYVYGYKL